MAETTVTAPAVVEPAPAATPTPTPNPEDLKDEPTASGGTYRAAYEGLQTSSNRTREAAARREAELIRQNAVLADALSYVKESQKAITKATLGEDAANDLDARLTAQQAQNAKDQEVATIRDLAERQHKIMVRTAKSLGIDAELDFASDAKSLDEYEARVTASWDKAIALVPQKYVKALETAKSDAEKETAKKAVVLADKIAREAGIDKVDLGRGSATPPVSLSERMAKLDPTSKEFKEMIESAKRGQLPVK